MKGKRIYDDGCGIAHAMNLVGERWAILIVRELLLGPKRFTDLRSALPGVGPNVLSQRLRDLETAGVLHRTTLPPPAGSRVYELTPWGAELKEVLAALGRWGNSAPVIKPSGRVGADSLMLGLRAGFRPPSDRSMTATFDIGLDRDRYAVSVAGTRIRIERGAAAFANAVMRTDADTFKAIMTGEERLPMAMQAGHVTATGDLQALEWLLACAGPTPSQADDSSSSSRDEPAQATNNG
jgi:DNA-binding HxlR family transcriptional regulator